MNNVPRYFNTNITTTKTVFDLPDANILGYFLINKTVYGSYINSETVDFGRGFAIPPQGVDLPTVDNFDFYVNGVSFS